MSEYLTIYPIGQMTKGEVDLICKKLNLYVSIEDFLPNKQGFGGAWSCIKSDDLEYITFLKLRYGNLISTKQLKEEYVGIGPI